MRPHFRQTFAESNVVDGERAFALCKVLIIGQSCGRRVNHLKRILCFQTSFFQYCVNVCLARSYDCDHTVFVYRGHTLIVAEIYDRASIVISKRREGEVFAYGRRGITFAESENLGGFNIRGHYREILYTPRSGRIFITDIFESNLYSLTCEL